MSCVRWVVRGMSCVWDELCEMSGVRWAAWDEWCELVVWDEWCEMSGVRWVVWDELCEMRGVRWVAWDERCEMSYVRNANITAATQACHRDTSFANANITAATQICRRDTSSANANITAAAQICHRDTSSANANITAARHICHTDTSSANINITAATQICHTDTSSANANITAATSQPRPLRGQSAPQLLQEALCTAPATQRAAAATAATIRAAAPSGGSVYCACHTKSSRGHCGDNPRRSSFRRLCVLRLPHKEQPRPLRRQSAPQLLQEALCTAPATQIKSSRGHSGDNPRRSSFRKLCVLRLPHEEQPRPLRRQSAPQLLQEALCTAPATQRAAAATPATIRATAPSGSVYCACHTKSSRGHCGDNPRRSSFRRLCVLPLPHKEQPRPLRRQSAPQLLQEALCTAPATQIKSSRGHSGDNPRRSSFRRLCLLRLPRKEQPRPLRRQSAPQLLPEALSTAPATQRAAAATPATIRAAAPSGGSVYCACHTKSSRGHSGDNPRRSSFRTLCVLKQHVCEMRCVRWVVCEMSCVWDELCEMSCVWDELCEISCVCDELCEMSCVWDEWCVCVMWCVRWGVWDELCEMSGVRWEARGGGGGGGRTARRDASKKTKTPQWCGEQSRTKFLRDSAHSILNTRGRESKNSELLMMSLYFITKFEWFWINIEIGRSENWQETITLRFMLCFKLCFLRFSLPLTLACTCLNLRKITNLCCQRIQHFCGESRWNPQLRCQL